MNIKRRGFLTLSGAVGVTLAVSSLGGPVFAQECPSSNDLRLFGLWKNGVSGSVCGLI